MGALIWQYGQNALMNSITTSFAFISETLNGSIAFRPRYFCASGESGAGRVNFAAGNSSAGLAQKIRLDCKRKNEQTMMWKKIINAFLFISFLHSAFGCNSGFRCRRPEYGGAGNRFLHFA